MIMCILEMSRISHLLFYSKMYRYELSLLKENVLILIDLCKRNNLMSPQNRGVENTILQLLRI